MAAEDLGLKAGQLFIPIRVAVTGQTESPGIFGTLRVVGRNRAITRVQQAIETLKAHGDEVIGGWGPEHVFQAPTTDPDQFEMVW